MLVAECRKGDRGAFDELVKRYRAPIFNLALRILGNSEDAMDVTQNTFLKAYERLDQFDASRRFFTWLYGIGVHEALNWKQSARRSVALAADLEVPSADPGAEAELLRREAGSRVLRALATLRPEDRALITLRHFRGLGYDEMAEVLSIPSRLVKSRLFSARQRLRLALLDTEVPQ